MTLTPLHVILKDLEESIKCTVTAHTQGASGTWLSLRKRLENTSTLSVYCDCSVIAGRFHLGVCITGLHTCMLFGGTLNTQFPEYTVLGEIKALEFAIQCVQDFIGTSDINLIKTIAVFSDVDHIQQLLNSNAQRIHEPISSAVQCLNRHINQFSGAHPSVRVHINFLGNKAQRKNIYYKAAHKVARKVAQASVRTV